jgi:hypothetical protein
MLQDLDTEFEEKVSREDLEDFCSTEELDQLFQLLIQNKSLNHLSILFLEIFIYAQLLPTRILPALSN